VLAAALPADTARVAALLKAQTFSDVADVVEVGSSLADLDDLAAKVREASPVPIDIGVDVSENAVKAHVAGDADRRRLDDALAAAGLAARPDVVVETVPSLAQPLADIRGGQGTIPPGCTAGFTVRRDADGVLGVLTAGHCGARDGEINGAVAQYQDGRVSGRWDVQWRTVPGHNIVNEVEYVTGGSTYHQKITGVKGSGDIGEGDGVCKSGIRTGLTCGTVISGKVCPSYVKDCESTFIQVAGENGLDMSKSGDSGAPVFSGSDAVGIVSGGAPPEDPEHGGNMIYMPVDFVSVFGLSVLTYDPADVEPPTEDSGWHSAAVVLSKVTPRFCTVWDPSPCLALIGSGDARGPEMLRRALASGFGVTP